MRTDIKAWKGSWTGSRYQGLATYLPSQTLVLKQSTQDPRHGREHRPATGNMAAHPSTTFMRFSSRQLASADISIKWGREAGETVRNRPDKELGGDKLNHFLAFEFKQLPLRSHVVAHIGPRQ